MKMIRAIVRQEKVHDVMRSLMDAGFPGMTKFSVFGRGKQRGVRIGEITYDELPKEMLMVVVPDADVKIAVDIITATARTGNGSMGDGRIFVTAGDRELDHQLRSPRRGAGTRRLPRRGFGGRAMKEIYAIIQVGKVAATKEALGRRGICGINAFPALGHGRGFVEESVVAAAMHGSEEALAALREPTRLVPKRSISIMVNDEKVRDVVDAILEANRTGHHGDGKIFVCPIDQAVRVRTGESGPATLD